MIDLDLAKSVVGLGALVLFDVALVALAALGLRRWRRA